MYRALLTKKQQEKPETSEFQFNIVSTFKDASGKKHKWTLRDTKEIPENAPNEAAEVAEVLEILTTLTIFQSSKGTRRFAEFLDYISSLSRINVKYEATASHSESEALVQAHLSDADSKPTPTASIHLNKKPQEPVNTGSSETERNKPSNYDPIASKVDAMYPLPGETPPTQLKSCSAAPNPAVTEKTPTKKVPDILQKSDTSYLRYGKTEEQIKKDRDAKKKQQKIARALGRKGRKKK